MAIALEFSEDLPAPEGADAASSIANSLLSRPAFWLVAVSLLAAVVLAAAVFAHLYWRPIVAEEHALSWLVAAAAAPCLPLFLLLLDSRDRLAEGPKLWLPLATLVPLAALAGLAAAPLPWRLFQEGAGGGTSSAAIVALLSLLALFVVPRVVSGLRFAEAKRQEREERERLYLPQDEEKLAQTRERLSRQEDAEALSAVIATVAVALILFGAYAAGRWSDTGGLGNDVGVVISFATMLAFATLVFLDRLSDFPPVKLLHSMTHGSARYFGWLQRTYAWVDEVLVRIGAHVAGMEHRRARARYFILASTVGLLCLLAWRLPAPLGLLPALLGVGVAFSVSRLWAWVEEDRTLAVFTQFSPKAPIRVGFREDFRDETLLAFVFVLTLIPITLMQIHGSRMFGGPLFTDAQTTDLRPWLGFLGFELAKALPVVDWADIYGLSEGRGVMTATRPLGMHAVFIARVTVDLVLISALLQALSISARNRQQKNLFTLGQINRVDEVIERRELARIVSRPPAQWFAPDVLDFRNYAPERLNEIRNTTHDPRIKDFVESILAMRADGLEPAMIVLARLAERRASENELSDAWQAAIKEHEAGAPVDPGDLIEVMTALRAIAGLKELKQSMLEFATKNFPPAEAARMLDLVMFGEGRDRFQYTRVLAAQLLTRIADRMQDFEQVSGLLESARKRLTDTFGQSRFVPEALTKALETRWRELRERA